jgi:hypothetical protein
MMETIAIMQRHFHEKDMTTASRYSILKQPSSSAQPLQESFSEETKQRTKAYYPSKRKLSMMEILTQVHLDGTATPFGKPPYDALKINAR